MAAPKKKTAPARKAPAAKKATSTAKKTTAARSTRTAKASVSASASTFSLGTLKPNAHSRPKRVRIGRGHGSGMVKTGGEGGKGQTVRSGGGKGPAFEGGQTPWSRRLPQRKGVSQKARDIGHFRTRLAVINLGDLSGWNTAVEVTPQALKAAGKVKSLEDGVKILGGSRKGAGSLPSGLTFRDVLFSATAREALTAAGATFTDDAETE